MHTVQEPEVLSEVITEQHEAWSEDQLRQVVEMSAPEATLADLSELPEQSWPIILDARRVESTFANVVAYSEANGVDAHLAGFLVPNGGEPVEIQIGDDDGQEERSKLAILILNAATLPPAARVRLAERFDLEAWIDVTDLVPAEGDFLARALEARLVDDTAETFQHFIAAGWSAVEEAFAVSKKVDEFLTPDLVSGHVAELLGSDHVPAGLRRKVVSELDRYVVPDDKDIFKLDLEAAGRFAAKYKMELPLDQVRRIAEATGDVDIVSRLLVLVGELETDDLVRVLALLGSPYSALGQDSDEKFDVPPGAANQALFKRLAEAGRIEIIDSGKRFRTLS